MFLESAPQFVCYAPIDLKKADIYIRDGYDNGTNTPITSAIEPIGETSIALSNMDSVVPDPAVTTGVSVKFGSDITEYTVTSRTLGSGTNEIQTVETDDDVSGGTFTLTFGIYETGTIPYNASAAVVEAALEALNSIGLGNATVTGSAPIWTVTFAGDLANTDVALMVGDGSLLTGGSATDVELTESVSGVDAVDEIQRITESGTVSGGSFTVTFGGDTTPAILYDATAGTIELNLESLDSIPTGECTVSAAIDGGFANLTFTGSLGGQPLAAVVVNSGSLTGGGTYEVTEETPGVLGVSEEVTIGINDSTTGGTFTLTHDTNETVPILYNATAAAVESALEALGGDISAVTVIGGPGPETDWVMTYVATGAELTITGSGTNLTGGVGTNVSIVEQTKGVTATGTTVIVVTPELVVATAVSGSVTFGGRKLEIRIGEGNVSFTENTPMEYLKNRGLLDTVRDADEEPMDVVFDFMWEFLSSGSGAIIPTIKETLKQIGAAATWVSASSDLCEPYCVDIEVYYDPECGGANTELIQLGQFRKETLEHNLRDATLSCTGKCNVTGAVETRAV